MERAARLSFAAAGLFAGPFCWAAATQTNYALVRWACTHQRWPVLLAIALAGAAVAVAAGWLSWMRGTAPEPETGAEYRTTRFLAGLSLMAGMLFALILVMQAASLLVFDGCER